MPKTKTTKTELKWFTDRAKEVGVSISQVSLRSAGHKDLFGRSIAGQRQFKPAELVDLAKALRVPLSVIFARLGFDVPGAECPLVGRINAFGRVLFLPPVDAKNVLAPSDLTFQLCALVVDAPHSTLAAWHGAYMFYEPATAVRPDAIGRLALIEMGDHASAVVGMLDRASIGKGRVIVLGGQEEIETEEIKSATPIRWQRAT